MTITISRPKRDMRAKRRDETHAQWQSRLDAMAPIERETGEPVLTPEQQATGDFEDAFVPDEAGHLAKTKRRKSASSLMRMTDNGQLSLDQLAAALEIAAVAESLQRSASLRCASLEARVDGSGSARDALIERLHLVRMEQAYSVWRQRLPVPKRMAIDMVLSDRALFATARVYRMSWPKARARLVDALDAWIEVRARIWREVDDRDVLARYARLGCGGLV